MTISSALVGVTYISFAAVQAISNANMTVEKLSSGPSGVASAPGTVYQYINIIAENITDSKISSASITFKVNATWMSLNNIDGLTVTLYRYSGGKWNALPTSSAKGSTSAWIYYVADTPGFSYFAVSAQAKQQAPPPPSVPTQIAGNVSGNITSNATAPANNSTASESSASSKSKTLAAFLIIVILFVVSALIYKAKPKLNTASLYGFKPSQAKKGDLVYKPPEKKEKVKYAYKPK